MATIDRALANKWLLRSRKGPDITIQGSHVEGLSIDIIQRWQAEFQADFCSSCVNFDPEKPGFNRKQHENNPDDCLYHWTDIVGACWNFREKGTGKDISEFIHERVG